MAIEIERKYLVVNDKFLQMATSSRRIAQGYLSSNPSATVRVRLVQEGDGPEAGYLTVKSRNRGAERDEWEYEIPAADAKAMLSLASASLDKTRYLVPYMGHVWEVDVFHGRLDGLVMAEIELPQADAAFDIPAFIGREVTGNPAYYNSNLAKACPSD